MGMIEFYWWCVVVGVGGSLLLFVVFCWCFWGCWWGFFAVVVHGVLLLVVKCYCCLWCVFLGGCCR